MCGGGGWEGGHNVRLVVVYKCDSGIAKAWGGGGGGD